MWQLLKQLAKFSIETRKFWFFPVVLALVLIGGFLVVVQSSAIAPVLYAIF